MPSRSQSEKLRSGPLCRARRLRGFTGQTAPTVGRPSPSRTGRISRRPLRGSGRIRTVAALSRHAGRSGGREVRRSSGQEVKWSGGQVVRRPGGQKIGRSRDQKVKRSGGQEVRWPRGRKIRRSEDQDTEKVRRPAARRFGPRPFRRRRSTAQRPKRFRHAPPPAIRKRRAPSPEPPLRNRRTGSGWNGSGDGRSTKKDVSFVRCRSAARMRGGPPRTFSAPVNEQAPRRPLRTSGCRDRTCRAHRAHRGALVHPGASCARNEKAEKFSGRF